MSNSKVKINEVEYELNPINIDFMLSKKSDIQALSFANDYQVGVNSIFLMESLGYAIKEEEIEEYFDVFTLNELVKTILGLSNITFNDKENLISLFNRDFELSPLNLKAVKKYTQIIQNVNSDDVFDMAKLTLEITYASLYRKYPEIDIKELAKELDIYIINYLFRKVLVISGIIPDTDINDIDLTKEKTEHVK